MLEDMLRTCVLDHKGSCEENFPLVEFTYNNSYQASIQMAPYEELYGRPCRSPICWTEVGQSSITGPDPIRDTSEKVSLIRHRLLTAQSRQKSYADMRHRPLEFEVGDHVFLKVMPKRGVARFGKHGKLPPRFMLGYGQNIQTDWNINAAEFKNFFPLTHQGSHAFHKNQRKGKRNLPLVDRFVKPSKFTSWFIRIFKGAAFLKSDHPLQVSTHEQIINDLVEC